MTKQDTLQLEKTEQVVNTVSDTTTPETLLSKPIALLQLTVFSMIGLVMFFVPFTIGEKSTILFDHGATYLVNQQHTLSVTLLFMLMIFGVSKPFIDGSWRKNITHKILTVFKVLGLVLAVMYITGNAPAFMMEKDMLPFLFEKLALPVGMIVPLGALILAFLVGFGLLEMVGVLMQPIMKPIWKTPGASAIDAVASFVGSYSIGLLITNRVYLQKQYSAREAIIIATGFSTVSAAFMVIVAKTLGLMEFWNLFFWSTLVITFIVTAITARIPPISQFDNEVERPNLDYKRGTRLKAAYELGLSTSRRASDFKQILWTNFRDGLTMAAAIVPSIIAVGLTGLLLAKYTPVFDALGLLLYPFTWLGGLPEPLVAAKGMSAGLAEMFLPALLLSEADMLTRYVAGVISISSVLFFSAMIPCVLATEIPISVGKMVIVWFQRVALSILLAAAFGHLAMSFGWIS
ncbi:YjiH family protein [Psychrobacter cryohalolentis]|uniref:Nucleoside recognition n=1 Tax=Psychrobacter cryohalolentis (strain ATCC BAA-1226 / DSM 17306 / VKM B-2378 / K5) TaxID=335284 RepID=Q1Q9E5_PSYCK|nr:YjiH family protein [Psychrobacter cryohalolentis]ABE75708.1 nucleoside recognition [Psychrobacter cryohalolentis K5]ASE25898.1 histidine transporter [Psychrobacter cryohalolentis]